MLTKDSVGTNSISSDFIYLSMRERIVSGEWEPGKRLIQRALAKEFGSSVIPVMESIRRLESDQLVTSLPNAGAQVRAWTERDVESVYQARLLLEGATCRAFAEQASPKEKATVEAFSKQFDQLYIDGHYREGDKVDIQLHLYIMNRSLSTESSDTLSVLAQNAFLLSTTINSVTVKSMEGMGEKVHFGGGPFGVHDELIAAFNASDGDAAERAIHKHVNAAKRTLLEAMNMPGFELWTAGKASR